MELKTQLNEAINSGNYNTLRSALKLAKEKSLTIIALSGKGVTVEILKAEAQRVLETLLDNELTSSSKFKSNSEDEKEVEKKEVDFTYSELVCNEDCKVDLNKFESQIESETNSQAQDVMVSLIVATSVIAESVIESIKPLVPVVKRSLKLPEWIKVNNPNWYPRMNKFVHALGF